ncbi:hypothetical protein ACFSKY_07870 [Azotobacter chroococcum]|uniref:hypothetical protein n=1 Tax=Azotobacter chroococcum TaxID=353 RepID=UPI00103B8079|nr:hypothetical protein [Azotobacter chroococcum]TBV97757.1 hypothetical protein E0E53_08320 [Azotobacter chroococcum]
MPINLRQASPSLVGQGLVAQGSDPQYARGFSSPIALSEFREMHSTCGATRLVQIALIDQRAVHAQGIPIAGIQMPVSNAVSTGEQVRSHGTQAGTHRTVPIELALADASLMRSQTADADTA